ncbi:hypothetical protein LX87_02009 [Larkinella arboricola]|uniref:Uncharacterized protein n=1 Tax=Larkinella arboricola TaxID=643671 RepID=A0A327X9G2_LARAB|nr:hypothetical protein LX87_02009 [Larkinella arboricola]
MDRPDTQSLIGDLSKSFKNLKNLLFQRYFVSMWLVKKNSLIISQITLFVHKD